MGMYIDFGGFMVFLNELLLNPRFIPYGPFVVLHHAEA